tara:strand:- start:613 stop:891 length:279 start_codon:yes stop_codon:yes gene_type:complete
MPDLGSTFCGAFALLGVKLLFYSSQPVSLGSVLLTACVAAALAQLLSGPGSVGFENSKQHFESAFLYACSDAPVGGPVSLACAMVGTATGML